MTTRTLDQTREFEELLQAVLDPAYRVALHLAGDATDAEDAVQEAALLAWRAFDTFERGTNFKAWYLRIVTNVCLSRHRQVKRSRISHSLDDAGDDGVSYGERLAGPAGGEGDPEESLLNSLDTEAVSAALRALPEEYRQVAALYFADDLPYQEIARIVGCPIGTVRSRLHRARRLLKAELYQVAVDRGLVAGPRAEESSDEEDLIAA
jgi:RNA polymerase sigma-70 factor, ECF subfamily